MYDAFGIYYEEDENLGLVAAGRWTSGGNSKLARRARVALQRRDRYGRWAEMGGGISFPGRASDGRVKKMVGRYVGPAERPDYMRVYVTEGRGIRAGIYEVPSKVATVAKALLSEEALKDVGVKLDINGNRVGEVLDRDIEFLDEMWKGQPSEFDLEMARKNLTKSEERVIVKARLKAPAHKSYNIVDEKGNRIDKDEPAPKAKAKDDRPVFPIPDVSNVIGADGKPIKKELLEWYVDGKGIRIPDSRLKESDKTPENRRIRDLENHRVLDGNGREVEFKPEYSPSADPRPDERPDHEDGFWDANDVSPEEVQKGLTDPQEIYEALYDGGFVEVSEEAAIEALRIAMEDRDFIGPDDNPIGPSKLAREVSSALESLPQAQVNRLRRSINPAALSEERAKALLEFIQSKDGQPLTADEMKSLHRQYRNLGVDLTNMKIEGKSSYLNNNLGAERGRMPQLSTPEDQADFEAALDKLGIKHTKATFTPDQLTPVQAEMDMGNVGKIMESWLSPELRAKYKMDEQVLYVTRDGYVIDGHHRWASALLAQKASGQPINLKCVVVDLDHEDALRICNEYNDHIGVTRQTLGATSANAKKTPKRGVPGEVGRKATLPEEPELVPAGERLGARVRQPVMNRVGPSGPDGTPLDDWLKTNLENKGDEIVPLFNDLLTEDKTSPDPEHRGAKIPGSRTMVRGLLSFRDSLITALKGAALDGNSEEFAFKYAIAKRVVTMLNQIHSNLSRGLDYRADTEFAGSTEDPRLRLAQARILPDTMRTSTDNYGKRRIDAFDAVVIAKNGEPFLLKFSGNSLDNYHILPDGSIGDKAGSLGFTSLQTMSRRPDGTVVPNEGSAVYSAFQTEDRTKALGLMTSGVLLARWVQHMYGGTLKHSSNLRPNGNFYSKKVSRHMRWAHRTQADKNVHTQCPDADIFKVLKSMGLINGEYIPFDPSAPTNAPGGWGGNSGGTGWLRRLTIINTSGGSSNYSVLDSYTDNLSSVVEGLYGRYERLSAEEKVSTLEQIPPVFRKFFSEKGNPIDDFDVQYKLLGTAYKDGMSKDETVAFLKSIEDGLPVLGQLLGRGENDYSSTIRKIKALREAVEQHAWNAANNQYTQPVFDTNWVRTIEKPFSGKFKFQEWKVPSGTSAILNDIPFANGAKPQGAPNNWNDNPVTLKDNFSPEQLLSILRDSLMNEKGKIAHIPEKDGAPGYDVNPNAVYKALENHGVDSEMMLAQIYDEINGDSQNVDAINAARAENGNLNDIISQLRREIGELDEPTAFDQIGGTYENQILKADLVRRQEENVGGDPALNFSPLQQNEKYVSPGTNRQVLSSSMYTPTIPNRDFYISGITDNPKLIARNFSPVGLKNALLDSIQNGRDSVKLEFANGSTKNVPLEAIRDALQYQGVDINSELANNPNLKQAPKTTTRAVPEAIDDNGNLRKRINFYSFGGNQPANSPHLYEEQVKEMDSTELVSYDLGISNGSDDRNFRTRIAKIKKNADGKFEVWVASRSENRTEDFSGEPMGVYDNWRNAYYDISMFIRRDMNLANGTARLDDDAREPRMVNDELQSGGQIDANNPQDVNLPGGIIVSRPDDASVVQIFNAPPTTRIPGAVGANGDSASPAYTITSNITAAVGSPLETFRQHSMGIGAEGQLVQQDTDIYKISPLGDNRYQLTIFPPNGATPEVYNFADANQARNYARGFYKRVFANSAKIPTWLSNSEYQGLINNLAPEVLEQSQDEISTSMTKVSKIRLKGGVEARVEVTVKKGSHPVWRRDADFTDNHYVYAQVKITNPEDPNDVYYDSTLDRIGVRTWRVNSNNPSNRNTAVRQLGSVFGQLNTTENDKQDAVDYLKNILKAIGGEGSNLFPEVAVVNAPNAREPRPAPQGADAGNNKFSPDVFPDFVAERGTPIDVTGHTDNGYIGGGASGAREITLPDGRKFKFKDEGEDKARQESFNHAIYRAAGVQVTEGRLGLNNGRAVLADAFQPVVEGSWRVAFETVNFSQPRFAQAIADLHEGVALDMVLHQWDLRNNGGNAFLVPDENGVLRGMRCDAGSGGLYQAIGTGRQSGFLRPVINHIRETIGDIMQNGQSAGFAREGSLYRGLTKDAFIAIARRTVLPLTDDKIDALVQAIIQNPVDRAELAANMKRRRLELLQYLGIDPNEEPPVGSQARVPGVIPGNEPVTLATHGYELGQPLANGKIPVKMKGSLRPDGIFVPDDWAGIPVNIKDGITNGTLVPENLPFLSKSVPNDGLSRDAQGNILESLPTFVDSDGNVRTSPYGAVTLMIRKRMADGTYKYLYVTPKADATEKKMWGGKYAPLHSPKLYVGQPDPTPQELMMERLGVSVDPVSVRSVTSRIPGGFGNHKVLIADIGDQDIDVNSAVRAGLIGDSVWREVERLKTHRSAYWNQFGGEHDNVADLVKYMEQVNPSSPSNQHDDEPSAAESGNGGDGPSNPDSPQAGGTSGTRDSDGYMAITVYSPRDRNGDEILGEAIEIGDYADGGIKLRNQAGVVLGKIKPTYHGHWSATYMPDEITGRGGNNNNGEAVKAIFADKEEAKRWLAHKVADRYETPLDRRRELLGGARLGARPRALFEVKKGHLNETTQDQRNFANRLIEQKEATSQERAMYRAILAQDNLTVGEVGWVISQLRDRNDRSTAEIEESRQAREDAVVSSPVAPSVMDNAAPIGDVRVVRAEELTVGHKIAGNINARVVFTTAGDNNTINIGVVGEDGKLRVFKVGRNSPIAVQNQLVPETPIPTAPVHPVIAQRRAAARLIQEQIKDAYPNARELPNGDLIVGSRDHTMADGRVFRFEAVVHKLKSDEFVSYVRRQQIDANGNPIGSGDAAYFTVPGHSPKAVLNRLRKSVIPVMSRRDPTNGYNQRDDISLESINPATGLPLPRRLMNEDAQFIGDTGIEKTGNATKDALIAYVKNLVAKGMAQPDIINQVIGGNQNLFTSHQMNDIIERLEWNRQFPGVNAIPYVSKDNATIVRVGDRVTHYDAFGNPILLPNGMPRTGTVTERRPYTLNRKPNGDYEYTDQLYVKWDGNNRATQVAARRVAVNQRADGSAPVPAVQAPRQGQPTDVPNIESLPEGAQQAPDAGGQGMLPAPSGMAVEVSDNGEVSYIGRPGIKNMPPEEMAGQTYAMYSNIPDDTRPENLGRYIAIFRDPNRGGNPLTLVEYFRSKEEAHNWGIQKMSEVAQQPGQNNLGNLPNYNMLGRGNRENVAIELREVLARSLNVVPETDPTDPRVRIYDRGSFVGALRQLEDGQYKAYYNDQSGNVIEETFSNLQDAINFLRDGVGIEFPVSPINRGQDSDEASTPSNAFRTTLEPGGQITDPREAEGLQVVRQQVLNRVTDYNVVRQNLHTFFDDYEGRRNFVFVRDNGDGNWVVNNGQNNQGAVSFHPNRAEAEMAAMNLIANGGDWEGEAISISEEPSQEPRQQRIGGRIYTFDENSNGDINVGDGNGNTVYRIKRESEAPGGGQVDYYVPQDANGNRIDGVGGSTNRDAALGNLKDYLANRGNASQNPAQPAESEDTTSVANMTIGGKDVVRRRHADGSSEYYYNDSEVGRIERNANGGYDSVDNWSGEVTTFDNEADAISHQEEMLTLYAINGLFDDGNPPSDGGDSSGGPSNPPPSGPGGSGPSDGGNGGNGGNNQPPAPGTPEPVAPAVEPSQPAPSRLPRPRVNPVKPGDRIVKYNAGRDGNHWDVIDRKTRRVVGRADTREKAEEMALGLRDVNTGELIDYSTPIQPRNGVTRTPRPRGYKRTVVDNDSYLIENPNDPNGPAVRVTRDRNAGTWTGRLFANKQDAMENDPNKQIGSSTESSSQKIDDMAYEGIQRELDRRNPPAPAPQAQPAQPQQTIPHTRTDFGPSVFAVHDNNNEYGSAVKGSDGKWAVNVFNTPGDINSPDRAFFSGKFDTPEEAEAAIRKAIADKRAAEQPANILQWQSGSDGKAYLGLDGIPGYDAENSPVWGISPMPFGAGWISGAWNTKADRDAGLPSVSVSRHDDEQKAKSWIESQVADYLNRVPPTNTPNQ